MRGSPRQSSHSLDDARLSTEAGICVTVKLLQLLSFKANNPHARGTMFPPDWVPHFERDESGALSLTTCRADHSGCPQGPIADVNAVASDRWRASTG